MTPTDRSARRFKMPAGCRAIPLHGAASLTPVRFCAVVREEADPVSGRLVLLRLLPDASVYLGCLADAEGAVWDWIELWVQDPGNAIRAFPGMRDRLTNGALDAAWQERLEAIEGLDRSDVLRTGWETTPPEPLLLDPTKGVVEPLRDRASGGVWRLCTDEGLLAGAGLPGYRDSIHRYLHLEGGRFVGVTPGAPGSGVTVDLDQVLPAAEQGLAFNLLAGFIAARRLAPLSFEDYLGALSGRGWPGLDLGARKLEFGGVYARLGEAQSARRIEGGLLLSGEGENGWALERLHLRLWLFGACVRLARDYVRRRQVPMLNLSAETFRVRLGEVGEGLPFLWTAGVVLAGASQARAMTFEGSDRKYFVAEKSSRGSVYAAERLGLQLEASGTVRLRKVLIEGAGSAVEGTLVTQEPMPLQPPDLIAFRLPLGAERVEFLANPYPAEGLAKGEVRFRSIPRALAPAVAADLQAAQGSSFSRVPFQVLPYLSTPCDLYSLGVLAVRTFLVDDGATLGEALDELLSLARAAALKDDHKTTLAGRLRALLESDPRWRASMGPERISEGGAGIPMGLWCDVLGLVVRLFPAMGPDSLCADWSKTRAGPLESVFDDVLEEVDRLVIQTRSLVVIDWRLNREVRAVIEGLAKRS